MVAFPRPRWHAIVSVAGVLAAGAVFGSAAALGLVVLPVLGRGAGLVDPNLGTALARELALPMLSGLWLAAAAHAACVWPQPGAALRRTLAAALLVAASLERAVLAPALFRAWSRVDLVTARPVQRLSQARELAWQHRAMLVGLAVLAVWAVALTWRERERESA